MRDASTISPSFLEGFVEQCLNLGLTADETEDLFHKHAHNVIIAQPNIYDGFRQTVAGYEGPTSKAAMVRYFTPEVIALAEDIRLKFSDDPLSKQARAEMGWEQLGWEDVPEPIQKVASTLSQLIDQFDYLPLNQKILLATLAGGGAGGLLRTFSPSEEDDRAGRGVFNRFTRGTLRGGATSAGVAAGAAAGSDIAGRFAPDMRLPGMILGGTIGGLGARRLANDIVT